MKKSIIVFAPHGDDETFACAGTIALQATKGNQISIVIMTDGSLGLNERIRDRYTRTELVEVREREVIEAANILGVSRENIAFFRFEDNGLGNPDERENIINKITSLMNEKSPDEVVLAITNYWNPDHYNMYFLVFDALDELEFDGDVKVAVPVSHPFVDGKKPGKLKKLFKKVDKRFPLIREEIVDVSSVFEKKTQAILAFDSQLGIFSGSVKAGVDFIEGVKALVLDIFRDKTEIFEIRKRRVQNDGKTRRRERRGFLR